MFKEKVGFKKPKALRPEIHYRDLAVIMEKAGFKNINIYPVTVSLVFPFPVGMCKYVMHLSNLIFRRIYKKRINPFYIPVVDSYCILAKKG